MSFVSGVFYSAVSRYSGIIINLVITAILARLLTPEEFGIITIATVFIFFFSTISESGISAAIVQVKHLTKNDISNLFGFTIILAIVLSILFFSFSNFIAKFYNQLQLIQVVKLLSLSLFFAILNVVPNGLILKNKKFKFLGIRNVLIQFICGFLSIIYAYVYKDIFALLINPILGNFLIFLVSYLEYKVYPQFNAILSSLSKIYYFSIYQLLFSIVNYFSRNFDNILIGKYFGLSSLGFYEKSYRLMMLPITNISNVINIVAHPILSVYQERVEEIEIRYKRIILVLSSVGFPISVFLFFNSAIIIKIIYGANWENSVIYFKILSLSVGFQMIVSSAGSIFQSTNNTKLLFIDGVISTLLIVTSLLIGTFYFQSLLLTVKIYVFLIVINFIKSFGILYYKVFKKSIFLFFEQIIGPLISSFSLFTLIYFSSIIYFFNDISMFFWSGLLSLILIIGNLFRGGFITTNKVRKLYEKFK